MDALWYVALIGWFAFSISVLGWVKKPKLEALVEDDTVFSDCIQCFLRMRTLFSRNTDIVFSECRQCFLRMQTTGRSERRSRSWLSNFTQTRMTQRSFFTINFKLILNQNIWLVIYCKKYQGQSIIVWVGTGLYLQDAHEKFLKINRAYEVLKDEETRKK